MSLLLRKICAVFLSVVLFSMPAMAISNYSHVHVQEEYYNASSPVGYFTQYPQGAVVQTVSNTGYVPVNNIAPAVQTTTYIPEGNYAYTQYMPASVQKIDVPQSYDRKVVTTETYRDEREPIDKAIDRSGKVLGILGIGALLTTGIIAIFHAF